VSNRVYLVSCVAKKLEYPAPARDLYVSTWFRKVREYVEDTGEPWYILSAEHGLTLQDQVLAPYNASLTWMRVTDRLRWSECILERFGRVCDPFGTVRMVTIFAGRRYREVIEPSLRERGYTVFVPLAGLGIGQQLHWFDLRKRKTPEVSPG
jgi:hypothetical protein